MGRLVAWFVLVGAVSALNYYGRFTDDSTRSARDAVYEYSTFGNGLFVYGLILAAVLAIASGRRGLFALRRPVRPVWLAAGLIVAIYVWELLTTLLPIPDPGNEQGLTPTHWEAAHAGAFAANCVLFVLVAPVVEELTFRGVGQSLLNARFGRGWAIVLVGVTFGLWHGLVEALVVLVPFGMALAYLRDRTRSVIPGMVVHALFNAAALAFAVLG